MPTHLTDHSLDHLDIVFAVHGESFCENRIPPARAVLSRPHPANLFSILQVIYIRNVAHPKYLDPEMGI